MTNQIHPTALVSDKAELGDGNTVGPFAIIEDDVVMGNNNHVHAHSIIKDGARIGNDNVFHPYVVFSGVPQDLSYKPGVETFAQMGDGNVLRECVTINRATLKEEGYTVIGNTNYFMANVHVAHDCRLGNGIIMANDAVLAGHVHIGDKALLSGGVKVHQFCHIGTYAMVGGISKIIQDCLPYMNTDGNPARVRGLNLVGLRRGGFSRQEISQIKEAYRIIFGVRRQQEEILKELDELGSPHASNIADFIRASTRSFHRVDLDEDDV